MIVGKGMIAGALKDLAGWEEDIIFSSGVSNSGEKAISAFFKEREMILEYLKKVSPGATFVYFSTTSIFDPSKSANPYIVHKLTIEKMLKESNVNYLILRLPNLVGSSPNPHTLTNYFADCIRAGRKITLHSDAVRHLIDVSDLASILTDIRSKYGKARLIVNVETDRPMQAGKILQYLEEALHKDANVEIIREKNFVNKEEVLYRNGSINYLWKTGEDYHRDLFRKYYSA